MKIIMTKNYVELSEKAAEILISEIKKKPNIVVGFATGKTPLKLYSLLAKSNLNFSKIKTFNLDELYPIKKSDKQSYDYYMHKNLFNKININPENINLLNGNFKNPGKECREYEGKIRKNPIDVQILGLGVNGHIAFNEHGAEKTSKTRLVELSKETIKINKTKNTKALTMGISTILKAKKIILLASGKSKAEAIKHLIEGKEDENWPVSFLRGHKNLIVVIDKEAGSLLHQKL
ncbi:MAG: glucosamine-6-phosphate deaminase [Nanoarchaeota archaeon]